MPAEVIDLLSSPSLGPSPPAVNNNRKSSQRDAAPPGRTTAGPSRALDYDLLDLTVESPKRSTTKHVATITATATATTTTTTTTTSKSPIVGAKRTSSGHHRQDDDFLFLSDDESEDDGLLVSKKPRVSPTPRSKRDGDNSLRRTASAAVSTQHVAPIHSVGMKRWSSMADPIEHSSSPNHAPTTSHRHRLDENVLDSSVHSNKQTKGKAAADTSRLHELSSDDDPFASSPKQRHSPGSPKAQHRELPKEQHAASSKPPGRSNIIDLSSDPDDEPPKIDKGKAVKKPVAWDPISSSMPEKSAYDRPHSSSPPASRPGDRDPIDVEELDSGSDSDDMPDLTDIDFSKRKTYSYSASPQSKSKSKSKSKPTSTSKSKSKASTSKSASTTTTSKAPKQTPEEKEAEKKRKAEEREAEKERKRVQKEKEKEQRALENIRKKALEEVNKVRTDKKVSTPEMIVDLPSSLDPGLLVQIQTLLQDIDVQHGTWNSRGRGGVDNVIKWRRKVGSRYNEDLGHWEPLEPVRIEPEKHVMVVIGAADFVKLALGTAGEGLDLEAHVLKIKVQHPDATVIYLIEGLTNWLRKNRTVRNRQFQSAVRGADGENPAAPPPPPSSSNRRRTAAAEPEIYIDEDSVEDALLTLQVLHGTLIHHTAAPCETAQWVSVFTQHISTIPYRRARDAATSSLAGFCMESGQVRTGDGPRDTYLRMLQEMNRVTAPIALGIAAEFGTVQQLVRGLEDRGPLALEDCRKCANRDGAFADRAVGPAVSKRMYKVFTGTDPGSMEV